MTHSLRLFKSISSVKKVTSVNVTKIRPEASEQIGRDFSAVVSHRERHTKAGILDRRNTRK
jgi:hypothetical protein